MNTLILKRLSELDIKLVDGFALFVSKPTNDLIISPINEILEIERKFQKSIDMIDKSEIIKFQIIRDNHITQEFINLPLSDVYFTIRKKEKDGRYLYKLFQ